MVPFVVDPGLLVAGDNVLAAEIHQTSPTSSDISFDLRLTGSVGATGVLENDSDSDGDPLTAELVAGPSNGSLRLNPDGSFAYFPKLNFSGTDTFTYLASDGGLQSNPATVTLNVTAVNDVPLGVHDQYHALAGTPLNVGAAQGVVSNDIDADGDTLVPVLVETTSNGLLTLSGTGGFIYVPSDGFTGIDQFTYRSGDGTDQSAETTVSIVVTATNQLPVASDDVYTTAEDSTLTVSVPLAPPPNEVFFTDFDSGIPPVFTGITVSSDVEGFDGLGNGSNTFSGSFLRNASDPESNGDPALPTTLTLTDLPEHDSIDIGFLLGLMDSWDGLSAFGPRDPDIFNVRVDGEIVFSHSFDTSNANDQSYSPPPNGELHHDANVAFGEGNEAAYDMSLESELQRIPHTGSNLTVEWFASGNGYRALVNNSREPESWAIDNVSIVLHLGDAGLPRESTLIPLGSQWSYLDDGSNQGTAWRDPGFDDASWSEGGCRAGLR